MNKNLKEDLKITTRSILYTLFMSMSLSTKNGYTILGIILLGKIILDGYSFAGCIELFQGDGFCAETDLSSDIWELLMLISAFFNLTFFSYFYAKICGLYKKLQKYNFWMKSLIFLLISCFAYLINTYNLKTLKPYETDIEIGIWIYVFSIFSAFLLNIFFNFLTKKFPKPFEKIGYICSIDFFKDIFRKIFRFRINK